MKCKCSLNNNYEVIGRCDMEKFNEKIAQLIDESWAQITIPEKVALPSNKPGVKNITKIYLDIKITSNKIIQTPASAIPSIEGMNLTGKLLLVSGEICQNIIYIPEGLCSSMCSVKFKNPFSTYIVIEKDADLDNDAYCVYSCIEDVSIRPLDERNLSKNITLFLFAHRTKGGAIKKLPNVIKLKNQTTEVVNIEFDGTNKKIIVNSTRENAVDNFTMTLYKFDATTEKKKSTISNGSNADAFKTALNDSDFLFGDLIKLEYQEKTRVIITNFPDTGKEYNPDHPKYEWFKITKSGLKKGDAFFLTEFVFNKSNGANIATVQFNRVTKKLAVTSTGEPGDASTPILFSLQRLDGSTVSGSISNNVDATQFKTILDGASFEYGDVIFLKFAKTDKNKVVLMNYPNEKDVYPMIANDNQEFKITENGVVENIIPNVITLNDAQYSPVVIIKIQVNGQNGQKLLVSATAKTAKPGSADYFKMTANGTVGKIAGNSLATDFETAFNGQIIQLNSIIKIECTEPGQVAITNFPTSSTPVYTLKNNTENFKVTPNGLEKVT